MDDTCSNPNCTRKVPGRNRFQSINVAVRKPGVCSSTCAERVRHLILKGDYKVIRGELIRVTEG